MAKTYGEKLKSPKWQKKAAEIKELHEWKCQRCGSQDETLSAHHITYESKRDPWDYPNENFECLCSHCHSSIEDKLWELRKHSHGLRLEDLECLNVVLRMSRRSPLASSLFLRSILNLIEQLAEIFKYTHGDIAGASLTDSYEQWRAELLGVNRKSNVSPVVAEAQANP